MNSKVIGILCVTIILVSCSSTSNLKPGNALPGIGLGASKDVVLLSWSADSPIARNLSPRTRVNILASYDTEFGPVTNEVISSSNVRAGLNGIKLKLARSLKFTPSSPVCLRLAIGRNPIPIRIATYAQSSSGFYYDEWAQNASVMSEKNMLQSQLATVSTNVKNFSKPDPSFQSWKRENQIDSPNKCASLTIITEQTRPSTAIEGQQKKRAAKQQCVALYEGYSFNRGQALPKVKELAKAVSKNATYALVAKQMLTDFEKYSPGKVYFPYSQLPIDSATTRTISQELSEVQAGLIIEAYQACETEAQTRFDESVRDWKAVTDPRTVAARIEPLRKLCRARFSRDNERLQKLNEFKTLKLKLSEQAQQREAVTWASLPSKKMLIANACPAE